jgi:hypothetical protein
MCAEYRQYYAMSFSPAARVTPLIRYRSLSRFFMECAS